MVNFSGKCRRYMKYIMAKPTRLYCQSCDETFALPQNGTIKLYQELKCPLDDFELLNCSAGAKGKSYVFCPYCFSNPPFPDMKKGIASCNTCTHPTCVHSQNSLGVSNCVECEGTYYTGPENLKKSWPKNSWNVNFTKKNFFWLKSFFCDFKNGQKSIFDREKD